jgi:killing trait domain-containing protein
MADDAKPAASGGESAVNSQVVDTVAAILTSSAGGAPADSFAMLEVVTTETIGMAMHNALARQQAGALVASAAAAAICARIGAVPPPFPPPIPPPPPPAAGRARARG